MQISDRTKSRRVKIFAKLQPPTQNDLTSGLSNQNATKRVRSPSPSTSTSKKSATLKSPSAKDTAWSFYALDLPRAKKIFYFPNPIQKRLLEESIKSDDEVDQLKSTFFASAQTFSFDQAFSTNQNNQTVYTETVKPLVQECLRGQSATVFLHGANETGKSYLLRGEETREKGLAVYAVEEIFKTVQPSKQPQSSVLELKKLKVHCSIFFVYHELCVDLIQRSTLTFEKHGSIENSAEQEQTHPPSEELIANAEEFKNLYRKAMNHLRTFSSHYKNITLTSEAHVIVSFKLSFGGEKRRKANENESFLNFVKLADVESAEEDNIIERDFQILKQYLCSLEDKNRRDAPELPKNKLLNNIPGLPARDALVQFICTLTPSVQSSYLSLASLKYAAELYSLVSGNAKDKIDNESYGIYLSPHLSRVGNTSKKQQERNDRSLIPEDDDTAQRKGSKSPVDRFIRSPVSRTVTSPDRSFRSPVETSIRRQTRRSSEWDAAQEEQEYAQERRIRTLENEINELQYMILSKIDSISRKSFTFSTRETSTNLSRTKGLHEEALQAEKSLEELKDLLQNKERLELEARAVLKEQAHNRSLKNKNLIEDIDHLSKLLQKRDDAITKYGEERGISSTQRVKESFTVSKDNQNEITSKLREKLSQTKMKYKKKLENLTDQHKKAIDMLEKLTQEHEDLRKFCQRERGLNTQEEERFKDLCVELKKVKDEIDKKDKIVHALNENSLLQEEIIIGLKTKLQEEKTLNKILTDEQGIYQQKIDALKKEIAMLEADNEILAQRHEIEKDNIVDGNRSELSKVKEKTKKTGQQLRLHEARIRELEEELSLTNLEKERAKQLDEELIEARAKMLTTDLEVIQLKHEGSSKERLQDKQVDLDKIKSLEQEVTRLAEELAEIQSQCTALKVENQQLQEEDSQKSLLLEKYESQLEYLQSHQIDEIESLHIKLKDFVEQINVLRADNQQKNVLASKLVEKLAYAEKERDDYMEKYKAAKKQCKSLKKNINQIDNKMKRLIAQNGGFDNGEAEEGAEYSQGEVDTPGALWKAAAGQNLSNEDDS